MLRDGGVSNMPPWIIFASNMLIRQNKDSFIRFFDDVGYIRNQRNDKDLVYNETGQVYLKQLSRQPQNVNAIISRLQKVFPIVDDKVIREDFLSFARFLANKGFVSLGTSMEELEKTGQMETEGTSEGSPYPIIEQDLGIVHSSTFLFKHFANKPHIFNLQIELTSKCNERCVHCYIPMQQRKATPVALLSTEEIKNILCQAKDLGTLCVTFSGGELLLRQDLLEILRFARECDFIISIFSNVTLLTNQMVDRLSELNIASVQVSLYSLNPEIHDTITGLRGSCEKTKQGIEMLLDAGVGVVINCPILKPNKDSVIDVQSFAESRKIKFGSDYMLIAQSDFDKSNLDNRLGLEEVREVITGMMESNASYRRNILSKLNNYDADEREVEDRLACGVGVDTLSIASNGDIVPCPGWNNFVLGNTKNDRIGEVWLHSEKINHLRSIRMSQFPKCITCDAKKFCSMCLLRNFNESEGDLLKVPEAVCQVSHLRKAITKKNQ